VRFEPVPADSDVYLELNGQRHHARHAAADDVGDGLDFLRGRVEDELAATAALVVEEMAGAWPMSVPLKVDTKAGVNWADAEPLQ